jgi:hypothetical protein
MALRRDAVGHAAEGAGYLGSPSPNRLNHAVVFHCQELLTLELELGEQALIDMPMTVRDHRRE